MLPGYPVPPRQFTDEEIERYLSADRIECLMCGRNLRVLVRHLTALHEIDEHGYRQRYGLPLNRSLVAPESRQIKAEAALNAGHDRDHMLRIRELATHTGAMRSSDFRDRKAIKNLERTPSRRAERGTCREFGPADVHRLIAAMRAHDLTLREAVAADPQAPRVTVAYALIGAHAELSAEYERACEALSFVAQARSQRVGARFLEAVRALRPLADWRIAERLGVTTMTVNRRRRRAGIA